MRRFPVRGWEGCYFPDGSLFRIANGNLHHHQIPYLQRSIRNPSKGYDNIPFFEGWFHRRVWHPEKGENANCPQRQQQRHNTNNTEGFCLWRCHAIMALKGYASMCCNGPFFRKENPRKNRPAGEDAHDNLIKPRFAANSITNDDNSTRLLRRFLIPFPHDAQR